MIRTLDTLFLMMTSPHRAKQAVCPIVLQNKKPRGTGLLISVEATTGFEPVVKALQASALPLGHVAIP